MEDVLFIKPETLQFVNDSIIHNIGAVILALLAGVCSVVFSNKKNKII